MWSLVRTLAMLAAIAGILVSTGRAVAQPFPEVLLTDFAVVPVDISSNDHIPNQNPRLRLDATRMTPEMHSYNAQIDQRRRLLANPSVRGLELRGPGVAGLGLSRDQCEESAEPMRGLPCTPPPDDARDALSMQWFGDDAIIHRVTWRSVNFADPDDPAAGWPRRDGLILFPFDAAPSIIPNDYSLTSPGGLFRFVSGPAVPYAPPPPVDGHRADGRRAG